MRKWIVNWLLTELNDLIDEMIVYWIESGRLAEAIRAAEPDIRARIATALYGEDAAA